eukprot:gene101-185_t
MFQPQGLNAGGLGWQATRLGGTRGGVGALGLANGGAPAGEAGAEAAAPQAGGLLANGKGSLITNGTPVVGGALSGGLLGAAPVLGQPAMLGTAIPQGLAAPQGLLATQAPATQAPPARASLTGATAPLFAPGGLGARGSLLPGGSSGGSKAKAKAGPGPWDEAILRGVRYHPKRHDTLKYGTAGFRAKAELLDGCMFRMGLLAVLRSKETGQATGMMITASHNPACDNGIKLVDPSGDMLIERMEAIATRLCNVEDSALLEELQNIVAEEKIDVNKPAFVFLGRDTRPSSSDLALAALEGVGCLKGIFGLSTEEYFIAPDTLGYVAKYSGAFDKFQEMVARERSGELEAPLCAPSDGNYVPQVYVDCANGVGGGTLELFAGRLAASGLEAVGFNTGDGELNKDCGADFVKTKGEFPLGAAKLATDGRFAAFDGDADRLVYFCKRGKEFSLLDGDRIATLYAKFVGDLLAVCGLERKLSVGLVQTGYANGASSAYAQKVLNGTPVIFANTGVKYCHAKAKNLDVGIYFEANGHGTIVFSANFVKQVTQISSSLLMKRTQHQQSASEFLLCFRDLINESVGDALAAMLAVEAILKFYGWSEEDWLAEYTDMPNRLAKVEVPDRYMVAVAPENEQHCLQPEGLQAQIEAACAEAGDAARSFVRPAGTEDVIRVYAEAATEEAAERLLQKVCAIVRAGCGCAE